MNRDLIALIVVFGLLGMTVGIGNSINVPRRPAPLPPEPVAGDIAIDLKTERAGNDTVPWQFTVTLRNVAGHPLLLRSPEFKAGLQLTSGSSETSSEEHSLKGSGNLFWHKDDVYWYGILVWLKPSGASGTQDFLLTVHYGTANANYTGVSSSIGLRTPYELAKMTVSDDTD